MVPSVTTERAATIAVGSAIEFLNSSQQRMQQIWGFILRHATTSGQASSKPEKVLWRQRCLF
jgi:hypothetical protein